MDTIKIIKAARRVVKQADDALDVAVDLNRAIKSLEKSIATAKEIKVLSKALTAKQVKKLAKNGRLTVRVLLGLDELGVDKNCLNDAMSEMIAGDAAALEDISYEAVGIKNGSVIVEVSASVEEWLKREDG
jgi:hypothetical protein